MMTFEPLWSLIWPAVTTMAPTSTPDMTAIWSPRRAPVLTKIWRALSFPVSSLTARKRDESLGPIDRDVEGGVHAWRQSAIYIVEKSANLHVATGRVDLGVEGLNDAAKCLAGKGVDGGLDVLPDFHLINRLLWQVEVEVQTVQRLQSEDGRSRA
jgi:hypothetical protein